MRVTSKQLLAACFGLTAGSEKTEDHISTEEIYIIFLEHE
jgi:hypothetical protein